MTDRPVIFSRPMVRALIREVRHPGTGKTMTRRLAWAPWHLGALEFSSEELEDFDARGWRVSHKADGLDYVCKPSLWQKVKAGDRLWVRENWRPVGYMSECTGPADVRFAATVDEAEWAISKWRPSIHMPRFASRLTLVVGAVKIERLQDISEEDAKAEGVRKHQSWGGAESWRVHGFDLKGYESFSARGAFGGLWRHLHGIESWNANPEVVALTFAVHQQNIDALKVAA